MPPGAQSADSEALVPELARRFALESAGSNAYGLGKEATRSGNGMVLGNPHFPWQGAQRFYQSHLTIPGKVDVTGPSLFGVPLVNIGHTRTLAWSHTVSTARRFTPYEEKLVPGDPTAYMYDGQVRRMKAEKVTVEGFGSRTLYSTHHGPVFISLLGLPIFPWTPTTATSMGDVNATNFRYLNHFFEVNQARSVRELDSILKRYQGIPWVNTIAADSTGEAYYADIGTVPHLTNDKAANCNTAVGAETFDLLGVAILDGSRSECEWGSDPDAAAPGILGPGRMPSMFRDDYVTNSNDSYWLSNPEQPLEGFPRIVGDERRARTLRTRIGLKMVEERIGAGGFSLRDVQDTVFNNRQYAAELFRDALVQMCKSEPDDDRHERARRRERGLPDPRELGHARRPRQPRGDPLPPLRLEGAELAGAGEHPGRRRHRIARRLHHALRRERPREHSARVEHPRARPCARRSLTPSASCAVSASPRRPPARLAIRDARQRPHSDPRGAGFARSLQRDRRAVRGRQGVPGHHHRLEGFVMAAHLTGACPESHAILTYSLSANPQSPYYADQTRLYSQKRWLDMLFCEDKLLRQSLKVTEFGCIAPGGFTRARVGGRAGNVRVRYRRAVAGLPVTVDLLRAWPPRGGLRPRGGGPAAGSGVRSDPACT